MKKLNPGDKVKITFLVLLIILAIVLFPVISGFFDSVDSILKDSGSFGPLVYMVLMIVAILVSPIPASPLVISSGIIFGSLLGFVYTLIGATIGAILAFSISRFFLGDYFERNFKNNKFYKKFEGKNDSNIAYLVFLTRLMPQISFDIVSYLAGLTSLNIFIFGAVTFIGMIPIVFVLTFFGGVIAPYKNIALFVFFVSFVLYLIYKVARRN